jgi:hypothetical protein
MTRLRLTGPGVAITSELTWFVAAPPKKGELQWKAGSSALELARAWCRPKPAPPTEMLAALDSHADTAQFRITDAIAEQVSPLDNERGEHRNHDLVVVGSASSGPLLVAVEGKAGEVFGDQTAGAYYTKQFETPKSRVPHRIAGLVKALTGTTIDPDHAPELHSPLADRGYQLLTASVGAVLEAERWHCLRAVLLVHEFANDPMTAKQSSGLAKSKIDLDAFVAAISGDAVTEVAPGVCVGPFPTHATPFVSGSVALYVAKCRTELGPAKVV